MHDRRVLVTGGSGFLGSHLCDRLLADGAHVTCVDNFESGSASNIAGIIGNDRFQLVEHDITAPFDSDVDQIFNLACPASPIWYKSDPIQTIKTNVLGSMNMLELARRTSARIFQASTSEVYGDPEIHPQVEGYWGNVNPIGVRACYDEGKRCAEALFFDYHRQHGVDIRVVRIFNTYGPRMRPDDGRVISNFIVQALTGENITIYGDGSQTRSFCYVDDLIGAMMGFMSSDGTTGPINIGNPHEISIAALAEKIVLAIGGRSRIEFHLATDDDPKHRRPDITLAKQQLGWEPTTHIDDGLKETIRYFRAMLNS